MKNWAIAFVVLGLVAGFLAFTGAAVGIWMFLALIVAFVLVLDGFGLLIRSPRKRRNLPNP
jgi:uncharacterized membrane protein HdeD (DUF308 family)